LRALGLVGESQLIPIQSRNFKKLCSKQRHFLEPWEAQLGITSPGCHHHFLWPYISWPSWTSSFNPVSKEQNWKVLGNFLSGATWRVNFISLGWKPSAWCNTSFRFSNHGGHCFLAQIKQVILCLALGSLY